MKKKVALPIIISSGVLALVIIAVIVLSLVTVNPLVGMLGGYENVMLYNGSGENEITYYPTNENTDSRLADGIEGSKFSVMHAILEGRFNYSPKFKTEKDADGNEQKAKLTVSGTRTLIPEGENKMLLFTFAQPKTVKVEKEEITFDRAKVMVYDTNGEIERITVQPYLQEKLDVTPSDSYYYSYTIEIWLTTGKLIDVVNNYSDILSETK